MWKQHKTSIILGISFLVFFSFFWFMPNLAFICFISLLLKLLLQPIADKLASKLPYTLSSIITVFLAVIAVMAIGIGVANNFIPNLKIFIKELPMLIDKLNNITNIQIFENYNFDLDEVWGQVSIKGMMALESSMSLILNLFSKMIDIVIIIFITFYLLKDGNKIQNYLVNIFPDNSFERINSLFNKILQSLQVYVRAQLIMCLITAIVVFLYFYFNNLPYGSVFAVLSGLAELIPVLGPAVASVIGILLTATQAPWMAIPTAIFYLLLTQINHNLVYPAIIGRKLNLHPIAIILGVILGGELMDAAGMFMAVPAIVIIKHIIEDIHSHQ